MEFINAYQKMKIKKVYPEDEKNAPTQRVSITNALNAKQHQREAEIVVKAGRPGNVTTFL